MYLNRVILIWGSQNSFQIWESSFTHFILGRTRTQMYVTSKDQACSWHQLRLEQTTVWSSPCWSWECTELIGSSSWKPPRSCPSQVSLTKGVLSSVSQSPPPEFYASFLQAQPCSCREQLESFLIILESNWTSTDFDRNQNISWPINTNIVDSWNWARWILSFSLCPRSND